MALGPRPLRARAATPGSAQQVRPERGSGWSRGRGRRPGTQGSPRPGLRPRPRRQAARPSVSPAQPRPDAAVPRDGAVQADPRPAAAEPFSLPRVRPPRDRRKRTPLRRQGSHRHVAAPGPSGALGPHSLKGLGNSLLLPGSLPCFFTLRLLPRRTFWRFVGFSARGAVLGSTGQGFGGNRYSASSAPKWLGECTCNDSHSGQKRLKGLISPQEIV